MTDFRIQQALNRATIAAEDVVKQAALEHRTISREGLEYQLLLTYAITPNAAHRIVDLAIKMRPGVEEKPASVP